MNEGNMPVRWFENLTNEDVDQVGGKNAYLGEMIASLKQKGVRVPDGFATIAHVYRRFVAENDLESQIHTLLDELEGDDSRLEKVGKTHLFDERNEAVTRQIVRLIDTAHEAGRKVGICGQAPSDYPEYAELLVKAGIDTISLNPDSVVDTLQRVAQIEKKYQ